MTRLRLVREGGPVPAAAFPSVVVGLMSGTSLDGISAAVVRFAPRGDAVGYELLGYRGQIVTWVRIDPGALGSLGDHRVIGLEIVT